MRHVLHGCAVVALVACSSRMASAANGPELTWVAPPDCPDASQVLASFSRMSPGAGSVRATATIERSGDHFELDLSLAAARATSTLHLTAERCETLADVVALELALSANASGVTEALVPGEDRARGVRAAAALFAGGTAGALPGLSPGLRAMASLEWPWLRLDVGGKHLFVTTEAYADVPGNVGAEFDLSSAFARACTGLPAAGFGVSACAGAELGALRGAGFGTEQTFTSTQLWGALTVASVLRYAFDSGLFLLADAELGLALSRPEFHARGLPTLFQSERTAGSLWLGTGFIFE